MMRQHVTTFFTAAFLLSSSACFAASYENALVTRPESTDRVHRFDVGIFGAGTNVDAGDQGDGSGGGAIAGRASYGLTPMAAAGIDFGWTSGSTETAPANDFDVMFFMAEMIVRFDNIREGLQQPLVPYVSFGLGSIWTWTDGAVPQDRDGAGLGWKLGFGIDWFMNKDWALFAEASYYKAEGSQPVNGNSDLDDELDFWAFGGGVKRIF